MTALTWNDIGKRQYEAGVDRGVLYPGSGPGVAWNGLVGVEDTTTDASQTIIYLDGNKVRTMIDIGNFTATIKAFTYPDEFELMAGLANDMLDTQVPVAFNFSYRTLVGNDVDGNAHGYRIHLVYSARAQPTSSDYETLAATPELATFSWDISTRPITVPGYRPTAHVIIDSTLAYPSAVAALEAILYGGVGVDPSIPTIPALIAMFETTDFVTITDNGDGTWTASGPPEAIYMLDSETFAIDWPTAIYTDANTYTISSP